MARLNIDNIENVEGKYHLMFVEGKNGVESAKNNVRYALFSLLLFAALLLLFIILSGFNLYYVGFGGVFLIFFIVDIIVLLKDKKKNTKQCIYAVQNSKTTDIVAKQVDRRKAGKVMVDSMSSTIDKYDAKEKFPGFMQKIKRKYRHNYIVGIITEFERENKKEEK